MCTDDPGYAFRKEQFKMGTIRKLHEGVYVEGWPKPSGKYVVLASGTMQKAAYHAKRQVSMLFLVNWVPDKEQIYMLTKKVFAPFIVQVRV